LATYVNATTGSGAIVELAISGNVTSAQMSNVTIATNQSASTTTVSLTVTVESGTTGFSNITIPISAVPYGTTPTIYVNGQSTSNQGYTQDTNNYYVWYTTQFNTQEVSIVFATVPTSTPSPSLSPIVLPTVAPVITPQGTGTNQTTIYLIVAGVVIAAIIVITGVMLIKRK
jgi:hypothetical protein